MPTRINDQKAGEGLYKALRTGIGQQTMLSATQLPEGILWWLEFYANKDGYALYVEETNGYETLRLVEQSAETWSNHHE